MNTLSVNLTHDASLTLMRDGDIILHQVEERIAHKKFAQDLYYSFDKLEEYFDSIDRLVYAGIWNGFNDWRNVTRYLEYKGYPIESNDYSMIDGGQDHHLLHAMCGYFSSPFSQDAAILVIDGAGSDLTINSKENESIFTYDKGRVECVYKTVVGFHGIEDPLTEYKPRIGVGMMYNAITEYIGFGCEQEGKTMGLSAYGTNTSNLNDFMSIETGANAELFLLVTSSRIGITGINSPIGCKFNVGPAFKLMPKLDFNPDDQNTIGTPTFNLRAKIAGKAQQDFEEYVYHMILKTIDLTGKKNIVLSGGCFMNCVSNYKLIKRLPKDVNLYVDPLCGDVGISLGGALYSVLKDKKIPRRYSPSYLGSPLNYDYSLKEGQTEEDTTPQKIADLLSSGNIVAIAQGRAESGKRALGNRSILFDPSVKNGREIVNRVKKRENWRPFAGTVMLEHAREWFDMDKLEESPHMTYAIDVWDEKKELIPSITHVNGTCRIQTVSEKQNKNYYDLISEFYKITGTPIVLNTSFNLAGDTIVETMQDALKTLENSEIEYLYLPDIMKLIHVPNK